MYEELPNLTLVLMAGLPGSGKTTLALALGRSLGWPTIDKDTLKSPMLTKGISNDLAGPASYALMLELADDLLMRQHLSAILDSPGRFPFVLDRVQSISAQACAALKIIRCVANRELRDQRLIERVARPSQWTANADLTDEQERQMFAHFPTDTLIVDTSQPFEQCFAEAIAYLHR
jgi:predicted kinase